MSNYVKHKTTALLIIFILGLIPLSVQAQPPGPPPGPVRPPEPIRPREPVRPREPIEPREPVGPRGNTTTVYNRVSTSYNLNVVREPYVDYPGYRTYGTHYGLHERLEDYSDLEFLTEGLLIASFEDDNETTVYVYHIEKDCEVMEYQVDENGNVISEKSVETADDC